MKFHFHGSRGASCAAPVPAALEEYRNEKSPPQPAALLRQHARTGGLSLRGRLDSQERGAQAIVNHVTDAEQYQDDNDQHGDDTQQNVGLHFCPRHARV